MTKKKMDDDADGTSHKPAARPAKKLHLREIRSTQAKDGSIVHHHTYADHADAQYPHPERGPMATSTSPEEAGQHVSEMFGQNGMSPAPAGEPAAGEGEPAPAAQPAAGAPPEE